MYTYMSTGPEFNILNMAQQMADSTDVEFAELFKKPDPPVVEEKKEEAVETNTTTENVPPTRKKRKPWQPSADVLKDVPEANMKAAVYSKDELVMNEEEGLKNIADDNAKQSARDMMDELTRKETAIEDAKARHGIWHFQIPEGLWHVRIHNAAIDPNYKKAQQNLDEIFTEIIQQHPEFIRDWLPGYGSQSNDVENSVQEVQTNDFIEPPEYPLEEQNEVSIEKVQHTPSSEDVKVLIDKKNLNQISWSEDEIDKIRKARTVELNIIEASPLKFSSIEEAPDNAVDLVLSQYQRKTHDIDAPLPASRYRATFTGLSYPEVLDLNASDIINNLDGKRMMWTIAYRHTKNPSIGPWEEYRWYIDPETKKKIKIGMNEPLPEGITEEMTNYHSKYDDFLEKTSYLDLDFIIWKILCATAMDKEIIAIDCHAIKKNGQKCNKSYDWIYCPNELLKIDEVNSQVLEEMRITTEAATKEDIWKNYRESPVAADNTVELPHMKIHLIYGHANAARYLNHIYGEMAKYDEMDSTDPTFISNRANRSALTTVKGFLVPKVDRSGYYRITKVEDILEILEQLDEVDWQVVAKLADMMEVPYKFNYAIREIVCPECGDKSDIPIEEMSTLLFIVARSLSNVQVELKKI